MKITVTKIDPLNEPTEYPCLKMRPQNGRVVLFVAPRTGICVNGGSFALNVGKFHASWEEGYYVPYFGSVTFTS